MTQNEIVPGGAELPMPLTLMAERQFVAPAESTSDPYPMFPCELKGFPRWVLRKREERNGKPTKIPYQILGQRASATDQSTWVDYATAAVNHAEFDGVGCVIAAPYVGIDLDKCRNPENGQIEPWAQAVIQEINSYTELSPSRQGVHIWVKGNLPAGGNRRGRVEMYSGNRYFTVTGLHLEGTPTTIEERDLGPIHSRLPHLDPSNKKPPKSVTALDGSDSKFKSLMAGHWQGLYQSQSEADLALCCMLARRYDRDPQLIDANFRNSGLYRDKWERDGYRQETIQKAIKHVSCPENGRQEYESQEARAGSGGSPPVTKAVDWRSTFKSYDQMERGDLEFFIDGFLPRGITFIGGLPGAGKTWFALSLSKALVTGRPFLSHYAVPAPVPVLYLIPEVGERAFRSRLEKMRLTATGDLFLCRTMSEDFHLLDQPELLAAVEALNPVVVLDTAIRFSTAESENSASDNRHLTKTIFGLLRSGARGVLGLHHATKGSGSQELTLENALRGTGDLGAICDAAWGLQCIDEASLRVSVRCIKARDFEMPQPFEIMGRPYIGDKGDFVRVDTVEEERLDEEAKALDQFVRAHPHASYRDICKSLSFSIKRVQSIASKAGWEKGRKMKAWRRVQESTLF